MARLTTGHLGECLVILYRGKIVAAPVIREGIFSGEVVLDNVTEEVARQIVADLRKRDEPPNPPIEPDGKERRGWSPNRPGRPGCRAQMEQTGAPERMVQPPEDDCSDCVLQGCELILPASDFGPPASGKTRRFWALRPVARRLESIISQTLRPPPHDP